jgi:hypothetical protein
VKDHQDTLTSPVPLSVRPDEVYSMACGTGALRMLSSGGIEALKFFLPVNNLFGSTEDEELSTQGEDQIADLKASVESLLKAVPAGFNEGEVRLKEAVRLLEEDGERKAKSIQALLFDLFGGREQDSFLAEFGLFAKGIGSADATADAALLDADRTVADMAEFKASLLRN